MSTSTFLPGVRQHPNGRSLQVRVHPFPGEAGYPLDGHEANARALELRALKAQGFTVAPPRGASTMTLADVTREHLTRLETVGGKTGIPYSADGMAQAHKECRPWLGEPTPDHWIEGGARASAPAQAIDERGIPLGKLPLRGLRVRPVETYLELRSQATPRAAVGEYQQLMLILKLAVRRGGQVDQALLALDPVRRRKKPRKAVPTLEELHYLAGYAPEHQRRLLLLGATLGNRIGELLQAEDSWFDADTGTLTVPNPKERRIKILDLLPEELAVLREQRLVRSPATVNGAGGTPLLFPRKHGTPWKTSGGFWAEVILPTRRKAAKAWRAGHGLAADAPTPFDRFAPHDLRRIATTTLRNLGVPSVLVAARLGHKDDGQLVDTVYDADGGRQVRERRALLRVELDRLAASGGVQAVVAAKGRS